MPQFSHHGAHALVEEDLQRVLELVRTPRGRGRGHGGRHRRPTAPLQGRVHASTRLCRDDVPHAVATERHRHGVSVGRNSKFVSNESLAPAKLKSIAALYGLQSTLAGHLPMTASTPTKHAQDSDEVDATEALRQHQLDQRRRVYRSHFDGLLAPGSRGLPKLQGLVEAAEGAMRKMRRHAAYGVGAAVLTTSHRVYAECRIESVQDERYSLCAERATLLKMLSEDATATVEAMVICSDHADTFPYPCGGCRELLADVGDFPIYLVRGDAAYEETTSGALFPRVREAELAHRMHSSSKAALSVHGGNGHAHAGAADGKTTAAMSRPTRVKARSREDEREERPMNVRDWTTKHVCAWLDEDVELPQLAQVFETHAINGCALLYLEDCDLQLLLGIINPLHRRRLLVHIDRLQDRELLEHGLSYGQLEDYLAVLDRDRIEVVAQLKETFDRLDANHDGFLDFAEVKHALAALHWEQSAQVVDDFLHSHLLDKDADGKVSFADFATAFSFVAKAVPAPEVVNHIVPVVDIAGIRKTFDKMDKNHNGDIDEQELVATLKALGRDNCEAKAREWFAAVDFDGDGRLSFAEFLVRYTQLNGIDVTPLQRVFQQFEPLDSKLWKPAAVLPAALRQLFPQIAPNAVVEWSQKRIAELPKPKPTSKSPAAEPTDTSSDAPTVAKGDQGKGASATANKETSKTPQPAPAPAPALVLAYAEFVLSCFLFRAIVEENGSNVKRVQKKVQNHALCHRSRIVHLQQAGHVRLCPRYKPQQRNAAGTDVSKAGSKSPGKRSRQASSRKQRKREAKGGDSSDDDDDESEDGHWSLVREVDETFDRFVGKPAKKSKPEAKGGSDEDDDDEDDEERVLSTVVAAQALLELGMACSRDQIVRVLKEEGFAGRRGLTKSDFRQTFRRLAAFQVKKDRRLYRQYGNAQVTHERKMEDLLEMLSGKYGKHRNRKDYDEYLLRKQGYGTQSSDSDSNRGIARRRRTRRKELGTIADKRGRRRRSTSSERSDSSSSGRGSNNRKRDKDKDKNQQTKPSSARNFRSLEVGDRVQTSEDGKGTLVRLYRDYFVADVHFDKGKKAKNVELSKLKRLRDDEEPKRPSLELGMLVAVAHKGTKTRRRARIVLCRTNNTFDVRIVEAVGQGEVLQRLAACELRPLGKALTFEEGSRVCVRRRHEYLRGRIELCRTDGTYDVKLTKGKRVVKQVSAEALLPDDSECDGDQLASDGNDSDDDSTTRRKQKRKARSDSEDSDSTRRRGSSRRMDDTPRDDDDDDFEPEFSKGDRVEARFQGRADYYPGRIARVYTDGTYDVVYDDGDEELRVTSRLIRAAPRTTQQQSRQQQDEYGSDQFESD